MVERVFCAEAARNEGAILTVDGDEAHHLARVRRVGVGEIVEAFDGQGFGTRAEVVEVGKRRVVLRAVGGPLPERSPPVRVTLATAVPKGDRFAWLVEKATELGVDRLIPVLAERSVVDPHAAKLERLRRTVIEASKQCGRNRLMLIDNPTPLARIVQDGGSVPVKVVAHPEGRSFAEWPRPRGGDAVLVAVGPEGGFTGAEVETAEAAGWVRVGLGVHVLRVETAGIAATARLFALGELAGTDS